MTDKEKLEKVRAEIERVKKNQEGVFTSYTDGKFDLCEHLLSFIDSMQEEPKECMYSKDNYTDEDRKVLCDGCGEERCNYSKLNTMLDVALSKETKESWNKRLKEETKESVSEDLEKAAEMFIDTLIPIEVDTVTPFAAEYVIGLLNKAIEFGANWQKQQMMSKAVDGHVGQTINGMLRALSDEIFGDMGFTAGDKVKLIIIKEE